MAIEELIRLVVPPPHPDETGGPDGMKRIVERFGIALPSDFVAIADTYGSGEFVDGDHRTWIRVYNPFSDVDCTHIEKMDTSRSTPTPFCC